MIERDDSAAELAAATQEYETKMAELKAVGLRHAGQAGRYLRAVPRIRAIVQELQEQIREVEDVAETRRHEIKRLEKGLRLVTDAVEKYQRCELQWGTVVRRSRQAAKGLDRHG
jgi:uncharacterized NAD(P)/FAD-binding protein YdhS